MNSLLASFEWMGSRFLVAGFVPALGFVTLFRFAFDPILPFAISRRIGGMKSLLSNNGIVVLIFAVTLGFTITVLSNFLVKIFEGYILLEHLPFLRRSQLRQERDLRNRINFVRKELEKYKINNQLNAPRAKKLSKILKLLINKHESLFPADPGLILPTRFGNILRSAEYYSSDRYHADSIIFWPRLVHAIQPPYNLRIAETRNQLSFVVNCSILSLFFGVLSWIAAFYQTILLIFLNNNIEKPLYFIKVNLASRVYVERTFIYVLVGIAAILVSIALYRVSLVSVAEFGNMIRSSYDLFRFDLLKALHIQPPEDSRSEREKWNDISEIITMGYSWGKEPAPLIFTHDQPSEKTEDSNEHQS